MKKEQTIMFYNYSIIFFIIIVGLFVVGAEMYKNKNVKK